MHRGGESKYEYGSELQAAEARAAGILSLSLSLSLCPSLPALSPSSCLTLTPSFPISLTHTFFLTFSLSLSLSLSPCMTLLLTLERGFNCFSFFNCDFFKKKFLHMKTALECEWLYGWMHTGFSKKIHFFSQASPGECGCKAKFKVTFL